MKKLILSALVFISVLANSGEVKQWNGVESIIKEDLKLILEKAHWDTKAVNFSFVDNDSNEVEIQCINQSIKILVRSSPSEKVSTFYHGLFKLGFLFPHPRWQITPLLTDALSHCGEIHQWRPSFSRRGFHLHTLHPNEWVKGFLEGDEQIAMDMIRWLARNRQNVIDLSLLRPQFDEQIRSLKNPLKLAKELGLSRGLSLGAVFQQQNSYKLLSFINSLTGRGDKKQLIEHTRFLIKNIDFDFLTMEIGTSEFTSLNYERALSWINIVSDELQKEGKKLFTKIHVSTNQVSPKWGNFNFLPRYSSTNVGVLPHTVMFYGLQDNYTPVYGNKNFHHMLKFIEEEKSKREVWYYPETSYWVGMDLDLPLMLTDYLKSRADDMLLMNEKGVPGHLNFTSGQELGSWLLDWNVALLSDSELAFDPLAGIKLLGEDEFTWKNILDFQTKHFKENQLISILSASNFQDEISSQNRIHERNTLKEISNSSILREEEILKLENALREVPDLDRVKNIELKYMLNVTFLKISHALLMRKSLRYHPFSANRNLYLYKASEVRKLAQEYIDKVRKSFNRYPNAKIFEKDQNITSYDFGYLWTAANLHFWKREELMIKNNNFSPFYLNIYNFLDIVF